jgi:hypothetical protein
MYGTLNQAYLMLDPKLGLWCLMPLSTLTISVKSLWSVLLVEETGVSGENHRPVTSSVIEYYTRWKFHKHD